MTRLLAIAATCGLLSLTLGCGGGTDVAPANPSVEGSGSSSISLDGMVTGTSPLVSTVVTVPTGTPANVMMTEQVTFTGSPPVANLSRSNVVAAGGMAPQARLLDGTMLLQATDYNVDAAIGRLVAVEPGPIMDGTVVEVDYFFAEVLQTLTISVAVPAGDTLEIIVYNVPEVIPPGTVVEQSGLSAPSREDGMAFQVRYGIDQPEIVGSDSLLIDLNCDPDAPMMECLGVNRLTFTTDFSNLVDPCSMGSVQATVESETRPGRRFFLEADFDDPVCP
ncbi:MAG: hypothetical protein AAF533_26710 [Acidobacteriota bacterium]